MDGVGGGAGGQWGQNSHPVPWLGCQGAQFPIFQLFKVLKTCGSLGRGHGPIMPQGMEPV